ncbi:transposase [Paramaledivibacter caminithermalis]|uniref:REP element-mobilizing transposase RayT n=1 Tax=Paramaledivibacter caminithermalis (strain DSM 15212 / CIP 107654 / DViRD3) TaxID=1121301 RepID=A0A1M6RW93_PARC5|nr:transposase [Paramaledivibacter caminithermalis]SHK36763.1 REP element-mobilizing transposase RayT [Paramaledivibacter caminithermalis DSM 15212]
MARKRRERSKTGIYHIMLRGIDGRNIFIDNEDREKFIEALFNAKEKGQFLLYGYCLMDNHVHLLIKEGEEVGASIKRMTVSYVQWHNNKYGRTGHLFQNRFKSEVVESESYLLAVLRYIHQNPVQAKIVRKPSEYKWSSYNKYINRYNGKKEALDTAIVDGYFKNRSEYEFYMTQLNNDKCLEYENKKKYTDIELKDKLRRQFNNIDEINNLNILERDRLILEIRKSTGASIRQLSRVLGLGRGIIEKAIKL